MALLRRPPVCGIEPDMLGKARAAGGLALDLVEKHRAAGVGVEALGLRLPLRLPALEDLHARQRGPRAADVWREQLQQKISSAVITKPVTVVCCCHIAMVGKDDGEKFATAHVCGAQL